MIPEDEIVRRVTYFNKKFGIYGDLGQREDRARKFARELRWHYETYKENHPLYWKVEQLGNFMPHKKPVFKISPLYSKELLT